MRWILLLLSVTAHAELDEASKATDNCKHDESTFRCVKYLKNYDADTITVEIPNVHPLLGHKVSVRVYGIDTAEMKAKTSCEKEKAVAARELVAKVLEKAKRITLKNVQRDKYFRVLAEVEADEKSLQQLLLDEKLAVRYDGGTKQAVNWCSMGRKPASTDEP